MKGILIQNSFAKVFAVTALITISFASITPAIAEKSKDCGKQMEKMFEMMFKKTDANGDGMLGHKEFIAKAESRFKRMDANGDGKVSKTEAKSHHMAMRSKYKSNDKEPEVKCCPN